MKIWHDRETGLVWELKTPKSVKLKYNWADAHSYAEVLNDEKFGGYNDWRLPTKEELKGLLAKKENIGLHRSWYWSSSSDKFSKLYMWSVDFCCGFVFGNSKDYQNHVICVRGV